MEQTTDVSFSFEVKEEIASHAFPEAEARSLLSSYAKISGSLVFRDGSEELDLSNESAKVAKLLYTQISSLYGVGVRFAYTRSMGFRKRIRYHVLVSHAYDVLDDLQVDYFSSKIPPSLVATSEQICCYLSGAFLSSGSVNSPASSNYHLEIAVNDESYGKWLCHLINKVPGHVFTPKIAKRRKRWIVYLKRSDQISEFLAIIGATVSCLNFESIRVDRDSANIENRLENLATSNMGKTIKTGERQAEEIRFLVDKLGWSAFQNPKLRLLMEIRLEHFDASLEELAGMMSEELASTITKSNVNHLLRALHQKYLAEGGEE